MKTEYFSRQNISIVGNSIMNFPRKIETTVILKFV